MKAVFRGLFAFNLLPNLFSLLGGAFSLTDSVQLLKYHPAKNRPSLQKKIKFLHCDELPLKLCSLILPVCEEKSQRH